jgi:hypothetical protein
VEGPLVRSDNLQTPTPNKPAKQTDEAFGSIKRPQRGEDDFSGRSDSPRGSEPEIRGTSGRRS